MIYMADRPTKSPKTGDNVATTNAPTAKPKIDAKTEQEFFTKNFDLSQQTARAYMRWARADQNGATGSNFSSMAQMTGDTARTARANENETGGFDFTRACTHKTLLSAPRADMSVFALLRFPVSK
jgi:hypothetical protein